jgi:hypothetical protein
MLTNLFKKIEEKKKNIDCIKIQCNLKPMVPILSVDSQTTNNEKKFYHRRFIFKLRSNLGK